MQTLLNLAAERAARYLDTLDRRSVAPSDDAVRRLTELVGPLPNEPSDPETVLKLLDDIGSPATVATAGSRFFGFVIGGSLPAALAANWLAAAWDQNAGFACRFTCWSCFGAGRTELATRPARFARPTAAAHLSPVPRWRTFQPSPPPATRYCSTLAGTLRRMDYLAHRQLQSSWAQRYIRQFPRHWACWAWDASALPPCP